MKIIEEAPTYRCDGCGEQYVDPDGRIGIVGGDIWEKAYEMGDWEEIDGKHYCPDCYEFDIDEKTQCCINYRPKQK